MKIPETPNVGAYYGNEQMNGQWQANGVMMDNGVGGGDGMQRPMYPVHMPPRHVPGYVMAGPYYPQYPPPQDDFADYMWMENEEEFDKQVLQQLEEEALMEQCIEAMLEDEQREKNAHRNSQQSYPTTSNGAIVSLEEAVSKSTLNPLAAEFVPTRGIPHTHVTEERQDIKSETKSESSQEIHRTDTSDSNTTHSEDANTDVQEPPNPPKDPPEVSAADINPKQQRKDPKKPDTKKTVPKVVPKSEAKVVPKSDTKVVPKSETKVVPKRKEVKSVKSESEKLKVEVSSVKSEELPVDVPKPQSPTIEESQTLGPKPINYAAAAKASKPKPKSASPPTEKVPPKSEKPFEKLAPKPEKPKVEVKPKPEKPKVVKEKSVPKEKVVQRKNSAK